MKYVVWFIGLALVVTILYKMYVFNQLSADYKAGYSYTAYNWTFDQEEANKIIQYWLAKDTRRESYVRRLMIYDFVFVILYVVLICNLLYIRMQQQNRLWLNKWLRMAIFSIIIGGALNLVQDYFNFLSIDRGRSYYFVLIITLVKWFFILLAIIPLIITIVLKPLRTIHRHS
jgi:hypothetical protein